ncbi:MAG: hypothetical protein IKF31_08050 [Clostridiales bacterium]|nr:hypothetical protein [Clostridiales bacterium]
MKKLKMLSLAMAVVLLAPSLFACSKKGGKNTKVKESDPWFESVRFDLEPERLPTEMYEGSVVGYSNGKVFHLYNLTNLADYDDYRRAFIDTFDEQGQMLSRVRVKAPEGYEIDTILGLKPDSDGKTAEVLARLFATGSFETGLFTLDLESGAASKPRLFKGKDGGELSIEDGFMTWAGVANVYSAGDYYIPVIYSQGQGTSLKANAFVYKGSEYLSELDMTGLPEFYALDSFSFNAVAKTVLTVGYSRNGMMVLEFDPETGKCVKSENYTVQLEDEVSLADYHTVASGELYKIDTLGNITTFDMQSQEVKTVIDNNWYTPYFSDLSEDVELIDCTESSAVIFSSKTTAYSINIAGMDETVTILKKADKNPHAGKQVIEIATPIDKDITEYLSNAIYEFNRTDSEYLIRVWSKYKTGIKAGRDFSILNVDDEKLYTMIQELNGDEAPDLAVGIQNNYAMRDEVFEDLTGYLDQEVMGKQFTNIIDASKIGGKQYFLPVTLEIEGLVTDTSLVAPGAVGITFEDFEKMIKEDLDGFSPYDYPMSTYNYKKDFILSCIDTKAAIEGDSVNFGTDQFYKTVEYADILFTQDGYTKPDDFEWAEETARPRSACRYERVESFIDFIHACKSSEGSYTIIGTPSVDASGPRFRAIETISVTSSSDMKEGCKKFINFLFAGAGYGGTSKEFLNLVTNKEIMAGNISMILDKNNTGYESDVELSQYMDFLSEDSKIFGYKLATKDMEDKMMESLSTISTYYYDDPVITAFLVEEIEPYYAGDRTLDDVVKILNDRANKYVKEM